MLSRAELEAKIKDLQERLESVDYTATNRPSNDGEFWAPWSGKRAAELQRELEEARAQLRALTGDTANAAAATGDASLDIPTISVPGVAAGAKVDSVIDDISTPLVDAFSGKDVRANKVASAARNAPFALPMRAPMFLVPLLVVLLVAGTVRVLSASAPATTSPIPTTTSRQTAAVASASVQAAATATASSRPAPRVVASSVQTVQQPQFANCSFKWSWSLDGVTKTDFIRIHFTGTNSHPSSTQDVRDFATLETNYKDGVYTWFGSGDIGGGEYTAQVIQLGPATDTPPQGPTLLRATC